MAYIGKVSITNDWEKLEDLIKEQVDGQSSFAFDTTKKYAIQTDGPTLPYGARFCTSATRPESPDVGGHLSDQQQGIYEPESGVYLYVKKFKSLGVLKVSVEELG